MLGLILVFACNKDPLHGETDTSDQDTTHNDSTEIDTSGTDTVGTDTLGIHYETIGQIIKLKGALDSLIVPGAEIEILADGFNWLEGPVWVENGGYLLFSDVPENRIYKWKEGTAVSLYLEPSGYSGEGDYSSEPGSNGLMIDAEGKLILCQHGNRQVAKMNDATDDPNSDFIALAGSYEGNRLNSPNDLDIHADGSIYFTDPPYGLPGRETSAFAELDFHGVFRVDPEGNVTLLNSDRDFPNGIGFSPDYSVCYVNYTDYWNPVTVAYPVEEDGSFGEGNIFFNAQSRLSDGPGLPDGLCVHPSGTIFSSGPGGILVISAEGEHLGTKKTTQTTSNCTFDSDYSHLYITADGYLLRMSIVN